MFENFFRKPEPKTEKEKNPERIMGLGEKILLREADLKIEPRRSGGYMLCSVLAMALAMGMTAGKAEAQVRGVGPQSWGGGGQMVSEVFHQGVFEIGSALNRSQNAKQDRIEHEYVARLTQLGDAMRQLDNQYGNQKTRLTRQGGSSANLKKLEDKYRAEKAQLMQAENDLKREYYRQTRNAGIKRTLTEAIVQGVRGW
jgi:hypothetical protein